MHIVGEIGFAAVRHPPVAVAETRETCCQRAIASHATPGAVREGAYGPARAAIVMVCLRVHAAAAARRRETDARARTTDATAPRSADIAAGTAVRRGTHGTRLAAVGTRRVAIAIATVARAHDTS